MRIAVALRDLGWVPLRRRVMPVDVGLLAQLVRQPAGFCVHRTFQCQGGSDVAAIAAGVGHGASGCGSVGEGHGDAPFPGSSAVVVLLTPAACHMGPAKQPSTVAAASARGDQQLGGKSSHSAVGRGTVQKPCAACFRSQPSTPHSRSGGSSPCRRACNGNPSVRLCIPRVAGVLAAYRHTNVSAGRGDGGRVPGGLAGRRGQRRRVDLPLHRDGVPAIDPLGIGLLATGFSRAGSIRPATASPRGAKRLRRPLVQLAPAPHSSGGGGGFGALTTCVSPQSSPHARTWLPAQSGPQSGVHSRSAAAPASNDGQLVHTSTGPEPWGLGGGGR